MQRSFYKLQTTDGGKLAYVRACVAAECVIKLIWHRFGPRCQVSQKSMSHRLSLNTCVMYRSYMLHFGFSMRHLHS